MNKRTLGSEYEALALSLALREGAVLVERNFRSKQGEIDLILRDGKYLVFAEVKYRANDRFGTPEAAVSPAKQRTICRVSLFYLKTHGAGTDTPVRFDVFAATTDETGAARVHWIKDAFPFHL